MGCYNEPGDTKRRVGKEINLQQLAFWGLPFSAYNPSLIDFLSSCSRGEEVR